jgi:hypothetical protein
MALKWGGKVYKDVVWDVLPYNLFPSGSIYFVKKKEVTPVVIHANYIRSYRDKREQLIQRGLWIVDEANEQCNTTATATW